MNSCFLKKSHGLTLTKEPNNLMGTNSFKYNGLVNRKTVGVDAAPTGKGVVLAIRKTKGGRRPAKALSKTIKNTLDANGYRKDLTKAAVKKACALIRSQN